MDPGRDERRESVASTISINVKGLERFLKENQTGDGVKEALRYRTMIHWLRPELDRLSNRMLPVYKELTRHLEWPFSILDVGCMCGWLKHFVWLELGKPLNYTGIDVWDEALEVARQFDPDIKVHKADILTDDIPGPLGEGFTKTYNYTVCNNIQFGPAAPTVIERMMAITSNAAFFGMPDYCGDYERMAKDLGFNAESFNCGTVHGSTQTLVKVWR